MTRTSRLRHVDEHESDMDVKGSIALVTVADREWVQANNAGITAGAAALALARMMSSSAMIRPASIDMRRVVLRLP